MERRERLVVETVEVVEIDTSEARDDADASESNEGLQIHPCSSSSCILIVTMIANGTWGTMPSTEGKTLGLDDAASVVLPLLGLAVELQYH
jgi:hypothetical protein